jgi:hypothetical protein
MKLKIRRNQAAKTGLFGTHKGMVFSLSCQVVISQEEQRLIDQYKVSDYVLLWWTDPVGKKIPALTVGNLVRGFTQDVDSVLTLLEKEETIKQACQSFMSLLEVMASFGGEETIEIETRSMRSMQGRE